MTKRPAIRRYSRSVILLSLLYVTFLFAAQILIHRQGLAGPAAYVVAIMPALPIIGVFAAIGRYLIDENDEYLRSLAVRQALVASGLALSVATAWGFLESFDLAPHFDAYWIAVIWFAGLGVGSLVNHIISARAS